LDPDGGEDRCPYASSPLHMPSGGEVSVSYGVYKCRISDLSARGESI
jgi:hypothetical protein